MTLKPEGRGLGDGGGQRSGLRARSSSEALPDAVGGGEHPAASDVGAAAVDLLVLLYSHLPLDLGLRRQDGLEPSPVPRPPPVPRRDTRRPGGDSAHHSLVPSLLDLLVVDYVHVGETAGQLGLQEASVGKKLWTNSKYCKDS